MVSFYSFLCFDFRKTLCVVMFWLFGVVSMSAQGGITVITHGFTPTNLGVSIEPTWTNFAKAIKIRAGGGTIYKNNPTTGKWEFIEGSRNRDEEIILIYDWSPISWQSEDGYLESAADNLFAMLLTPPQDMRDQCLCEFSMLSRPKHFIAHSRGTIVMLQLAYRLAKYFPTTQIEHLTLLDPHPASLMNDVSTESENKSLPCVYGVPTNCSISSGTTIGCANGNAVYLRLPENVKKSDAYYRKDGEYEALDWFDFDGVPVRSSSGYVADIEVGTRCEQDPFNFNRRLKDNLATSAHSAVHAWYLGTILPNRTTIYPNTTIPTNWYSLDNISNHIAFCDIIWGARTEIGYNQSRIGGLLYNIGSTINTIPLADLDARIKKRTGNNLNPIFNGNFQYGKVGWLYNGGQGGDVNVNPDGKYAVLEGSQFPGADSIKHSTLHFPEKLKWLQFSGKSSTIANIKVSFFDFNGKYLMTTKQEAVVSNTVFKKFHTPIPQNLIGKVGSFSIKNTGNNQVIIDDIFLAIKPEGTLFQIAPPNGGSTTESVNNYEDAVFMYRDYAENNFTNLSNNAWYKNYAQDGAGYGLFEGDAYNSFNPFESVTRGEVVGIIVNSALKLNILRGGNLNISTTNGLFSDVPEDHQYFPYIQALRNLGYLNINASNTFNPDDNITLGQFCKLLSLTYWDNITPPATTSPNVNATSQFNVVIPSNTNPDFVPHISKILNTFTAKTRGTKRWAERIFNFKLNTSSTGYDNVIDANAVLDRVSMTKAMTNVFEFRRNELANTANVANFITLGEKWELPANTVGSSANFSTINDVDLRMTAGEQLSLTATIPNLDNPHFYWSINGGTLRPNTGAVNFNTVNFTAPQVTVSTTLTLYVYAGSTSGRAVEIVKNIIVSPSGTIPTRDSVDLKFRVSLKGTGRKIHPTGVRITGALGAFTQPDWTPSAAQIMVLETPIRDSIYTATIKIPRRTAPNDVYEFKYVNGNDWGDGSNGTPEDERGLTEECRVSEYWNRAFTLIPLPATSMTLPCYLFNTCTVYTQSVLSVEFIHFNVTHKNGINTIAWQTATERNSDHFDIERSTDGKQFIKIGAIKAFGSTNQVQNYSYLDASLPPQYNVFYYRLRQVDTDNKAEYSPIRSISIDKQDKPAINIYPNPNNGQFVAFVPTSDKETDITIQNSHGQVIWKGNIVAGQQSRDILLDQAANGLYFVSCRNSEGFMKTTKFVINR